MRRMSLVLPLILAAGGLSHAPAGFAQDESPSVPVPAPPSEAELPAAMVVPDTAELTAQDLEAWLDGFIPYALERGDIAGAVVVVVDDGEVLFEQGYGYADVEAETPVDAATTLFRIGSVSKLFTWTAVMQLVEAGKLDLDGDVNRWLDFEIPPFDGAPVTLRNILTHTPGFEENAKELMSADLAELDTLRDAVADWVPERIFPAGTTPAYSNYATALAGYIVERVSGQPFDDYIEQHILDPLGMHYTTFRQPLPERLEPHMSKGYQLGSEAPKPYELVAMAPAGSVAASGADMARFMIAHLQNGHYGEAQILRADTAEIMHTTAAPGIPPLNRMMLGFYETNVNGRRVIAHGGDTQWFHSYLHLFLDEGTGIFVSTNSAGKEGASGAIRAALFEQFSNRYFPEPIEEGEMDVATAAEHAGLMAGRYVNSRRSASNFLAVLNLFGQVQVTAQPDGTLIVPALLDLAGQPRAWREVEPFVWREVGAGTRLAAAVDSGRVDRFSVDPLSPFMVFEPVPWWRSSAWLIPALVLGLVALFLSAIFWPVRALVRRRFGARLALSGRDLQAYRLTRIAALAVLLVLAGWAIMLSYVLSDYTRLTSSLDALWWLLQIAGLVVFIGAAVITLWNLWVVWTGKRSWFAKIWSPVLAASCLVVLWVAFAFKLIALTVNY